MPYNVRVYGFIQPNLSVSSVCNVYIYNGVAKMYIHCARHIAERCENYGLDNSLLVMTPEFSIRRNVFWTAGNVPMFPMFLFSWILVV